MFDNLPFKTNDKETIENFLKSGVLKPISESVNYTVNGEQYTSKRVYKYLNLTVTITYLSMNTYKELICRGSFHYLKNNGKHNADSLDFEDVTSVLRNFTRVFNVDLKHLHLCPYEIGVNLDCYPFNVTKIVQYTLNIERKCFGYNPTHVVTSKISGKPSNDYRLKVYSKSHDLPNYSEPNNLRMELQFKKMRYSEGKGIMTLADLLIIDNWKILKEKYFEKFNLIAIYDYTINEKKVPKSKRHLLNYSNDNAWRDLVEKCKNKEEYYSKYNDVLSDLNNLSKLYGSKIKDELIVKAEQRWENFFNYNLKTEVCTTFKT
ncbi:hypothetical protein CW736_13025 [Nonlabens sp. MB-3u-79]|uniref:hypothetical protein n=1 Tax=Nonlabens sp. MB-3u-79 TaxID=2058134 RepID=UPI000C305C4E|nr:hypothetical protein [Nonlabens sp. MB-3u-79]AUC80240.1 hypothetical protein CW736_13025 [Nonlabens sp. MB-3u-79]